jgi:hypothetical protein
MKRIEIREVGGAEKQSANEQKNSETWNGWLLRNFAYLK